jgi:hypothetical protein
MEMLKRIYETLKQVQDRLPRLKAHDVRVALCLYTEAPEMMEVRVTWYQRLGASDGGKNSFRVAHRLIRRFTESELCCAPVDLDIVTMICDHFADEYQQRFCIRRTFHRRSQN